ncbi:hypothetical protein L596_005475 [Steinernema carpocapsae]|uniref:Uncharacterized protein n=1 Tax=Steinernema carpocapsae TaxID=34508 RepID=A0A4U8V0Q2_STECR|nr:hypothetical protein L596_005475 [Steinernema carpocapsae]
MDSIVYNFRAAVAARSSGPQHPDTIENFRIKGFDLWTYAFKESWTRQLHLQLELCLVNGIWFHIFYDLKETANSTYLANILKMTESFQNVVVDIIHVLQPSTNPPNNMGAVDDIQTFMVSVTHITPVPCDNLVENFPHLRIDDTQGLPDGDISPMQEMVDALQMFTFLHISMIYYNSLFDLILEKHLTNHCKRSITYVFVLTEFPFSTIRILMDFFRAAKRDQTQPNDVQFANTNLEDWEAFEEYLDNHLVAAPGAPVRASATFLLSRRQWVVDFF